MNENAHEGDTEQWPVCRVGMKGRADMKIFTEAMLAFYSRPDAVHGEGKR